MFLNSALRQMQKRILVALDFDHTIVDDNTDIVARELVPSAKIPPDVNNLYKSDGWTSYMGKIFELLHENGVTREKIHSAICNIPVTPGVDALLKFLHSKQCEAIIISDSNSVFISDWLRSSLLDITVQSVFTNPAHYDDNDCLRIQMYHVQNWCQLSTKNLCKGHILEGYIDKRRQEGTRFDHICYIGDGKNDLCPILRLSENDLAFPREDYALEKIIRKHPVKAAIHPWNTGETIIDVISKYV